MTATDRDTDRHNVGREAKEKEERTIAVRDAWKGQL